MTRCSSPSSSAEYPQLVSFQGKVIAAYVDNRGGSSTQGQLRFRVSTDSGATWAAEYSPFGVETFSTGATTPLLGASRNGATLYLFSCCVSSLPQYRSTVDPALATWSAAAVAGDATMRLVAGNNCGNSGQECYRAHAFEFMETATPGQWIYIAKSDSGFGQSGRGTQVGTLGGAWSAQVDHGGSGGVTGCCGDSRATTFLDRSGNILYVRADSFGQNLYHRKSLDGGVTWGARVYAYSSTLMQYTTASPVGLHVPGYSRGEYVWYAGFGGVGIGNDQNAVRVIPLWSEAKAYGDSATARLFGSAGGDWDFGTAYPHTFGARDIPTGVGAFKTAAQDLAIPGRLLDLSLTRSYTSADPSVGPLGAGWTHSFNSSVLENGALVEVRRGDGRRDAFTRGPDGTYAPPPNVFDVLTKNADSSFTLTLKDQTRFEFAQAGQLTRIHEPGGNQLTLAYRQGRLVGVTDTVGRAVTFGYTDGDNLTRGRSYTKSVAADTAYPDTGGTELTDGTVGSATDFRDPAWQGHPNLAAPLDVTVDLGSIQALGLFRSYFFDSPGDGVYRPVLVEILTSADNITYTANGSTAAASAVNEAGKLWRYELSAAASGRYVRFRSTKGGTWLFSSELQAYSSANPPPVAQSGTNVGLGRTYTGSAAPSASYPDTGGTELTDGTLGHPTSYTDASWQGHQNLGATPLDGHHRLCRSLDYGISGIAEVRSETWD